MSQVLDLRKNQEFHVKIHPLSHFKKLIEVISVIFISSILTTLAIKAVDKTNLIASLTGDIQKENQKCPPDMVFIPSENGGFCIDKYENSPGPNCPFSNPQNQEETRKNLEDPKCYPVSKEGTIPWTNISQNQAQLACAKAGKRLPSPREWYLASLGTPDKSEGWTKDDCNLNKNWDQNPGPTGSGKNCKSSFEVYDMIGNVWEWVGGSVVDGKYQDRELPQQGFVWGIDDETGLPFQTENQNPNSNYNNDYFWIVKKGTRAIAKGGYFQSGSDGGVYSSSLIALPSDFSSGVGFRCAK
jgi:formylglycine-generating enzyme required for sulfatase activity